MIDDVVKSKVGTFGNSRLTWSDLVKMSDVCCQSPSCYASMSHNRELLVVEENCGIVHWFNKREKRGVGAE